MSADVIPFPRSPARVVVAFPPRTDLGGYRASLRYVDVVLICKRALSAITLGKDPETAHRARETLRHIEAYSDWPQARLLAAAYLRSVDGGKA